MADTVEVNTIFNGLKRKAYQLLCVSDGTGEAAVTKVDISTLTYSRGLVPTWTTIDLIDYNIQGFSSVRLFWDHTTDDEIAILPEGSGCIDFAAYGGKTDPKTAGDTGDIKLTSVGALSGATYDITIHLRPKGP
jgi:hypothetical protein